MLPKLTISLQTKVTTTVILLFSISFKWMWSYRIRIFEKILWLSKTSLIQRANFSSCLNRPCEIVVIWNDWTSVNMDPWNLPICVIGVEFILSRQDDDLIVMQNVQFEFQQDLLLAIRTSTVTGASRKGTMNTFTHNFVQLSTLGWKFFISCCLE